MPRQGNDHKFLVNAGTDSGSGDRLGWLSSQCKLPRSQTYQNPFHACIHENPRDKKVSRTKKAQKVVSMALTALDLA